jgi:hypothetical protein
MVMVMTMMMLIEWCWNVECDDVYEHVSVRMTMMMMMIMMMMIMMMMKGVMKKPMMVKG